MKGKKRLRILIALLAVLAVYPLIRPWVVAHLYPFYTIRRAPSHSDYYIRVYASADRTIGVVNQPINILDVVRGDAWWDAWWCHDNAVGPNGSTLISNEGLVVSGEFSSSGRFAVQSVTYKGQKVRRGSILDALLSYPF